MHRGGFHQRANGASVHFKAANSEYNMQLRQFDIGVLWRHNQTYICARPLATTTDY
jgi:hypothetical protein